MGACDTRGQGPPVYPMSWKAQVEFRGRGRSYQRVASLPPPQSNSEGGGEPTTIVERSSEDVSYSSERGVLEDNDISGACYSISSRNLVREVVKSTEIAILRSC